MNGTYTPPQVGDREGRYVWTGQAWTFVCPDCDLPMVGFDNQGRPCCPVCALAAADVLR